MSKNQKQTTKPNDDRSNSMNKNNGAKKASDDNRSVQIQKDTQKKKK